MSISNINSDSLWKWLAIAGTAVLIGFGTSIERQYTELNKAVEEREVSNALIEANLDLCRNVSVITGSRLPGATNGNHFHVQLFTDLSSGQALQARFVQNTPSAQEKCSASIRRDTAVNRAKVEAAQLRLRATRSYIMGAFAASLVGLCAASIGFLGWRHDQYLDARIKQLSITSAELEIESKQLDEFVSDSKDNSVKNQVRREIVQALTKSKNELPFRDIVGELNGFASKKFVATEIQQMEKEGLLEVNADQGALDKASRRYSNTGISEAISEASTIRLMYRVLPASLKSQ